MKTDQTMINAYIRMWPRQVYNLKIGNKHLESIRQELHQKSGIYILYRNGTPHYVGQARNLWRRIRNHTINQNAKHYHHWTHFSAFILSDIEHMNELEGLIIAASGLGIANSARHRMKMILLPKDARKALSKFGGVQTEEL
jgi:hypothetical protein